MDDQIVNVYNFREDKATPDAFFDYPDTLRDCRIPLIIDNGSYKCRVGWASDNQPRMVFKNVIARQRSKKDSDATVVQIGNDITNIEVVRWQLKSQFDRNIVTQYDVQEQIYDYIFTHLGINTAGKVDHPMVITEPVCNPNYCRQQMSELLFECYHVPKVSYGVDALFSLYNNHPNPAKANSLVVSCGYHTTHLLPVLNGQLQARLCRRINVGGMHTDSFMQKLLQLKYPGHLPLLTLSRAEQVIQSHCTVATDYTQELQDWADEDHYEDNVHRFQLPFNQTSGTSLTPVQQKEKKEQQIKRLKEMAAKRREDKLAGDQERLQQLLSIQELIQDDDEAAFQKALKDNGFKNAAELQANINKLNSAIQKIRYKIMAEESQEEQSIDLLDTPDDQLTVDQQEAKKKQKMKGGRDTTPRAKKMREDRKPMDVYRDQQKGKDFDVWLADIRKKREDLLEARTQRRQRRADMAKRRTYASQQRMKIISQLASGHKRKKEDTFGQNDDDWNVYKEISKEGADSDSEAEQEKLDELESILKHHDPEFGREQETQDQEPKNIDLAEYYRVHVGVERMRVPELLFQPSMIGSDQAGVTETMDFMFKKMTPEEQNKIVQYVFLTGGCASFPNLKTRLENELLSIRPFQSTFGVHTAVNPVLDAWYGARRWALSPALNMYSITRQEYEEKGGEYLKEHTSSNRYYPTPVTNPSHASA